MNPELEATLTRLKIMRERLMAKRAELQETIETVDKAFDLIAFDTRGDQWQKLNPQTERK